MSVFEAYCVLGLFFIMCLSACYSFFVVMVVTPRVDRYNGYKSTTLHLANQIQTTQYFMAFHPFAYIKRTKLYREKLVYYRAEPRDIFYFKLYGYSLIIGGLAFFVAICIGIRW